MDGFQGVAGQLHELGVAIHYIATGKVLPAQKGPPEGEPAQKNGYGDFQPI